MLFRDASSIVDPIRVPGKLFRDGPLLPEMVVLPRGKFWMGGGDEDLSAVASEKPRRWVEIGHWLAVGRRPVTFEEWDAFADSDAFAHRPDDRGLGRGRLPVLNVSWEDAEAYVSWLSVNTSRPYRLLSEAEWEYCGRAGSLCEMHNDVRELVADAWHDDYRGAPPDGSAWEETSATIWRVVRGGTWDAPPSVLRSSFRDRVHHTERLNNMGFRVACSLD